MTQLSSHRNDSNMANLRTKGGVFGVRFRFQGKEYQRSFKTRDPQLARLGLQQVEQRLAMVRLGLLAIPPDRDAGDFIVQGSLLSQTPFAAPPSAPETIPVAPATSSQSPPPATAAPELNAAVEEYLGRLEHLAQTHRNTKRTHLNHLCRYFGKRKVRRIDQIQFADLDNLLQTRLRRRSSETVKKERETIGDFFDWAERCHYIPASPAKGLPPIKSRRNQDPFRTVDEIEESIRRGGLSRTEIKDLWKALYLTPAEIVEILQLVETNATAPASGMLHAIAAFTGMRRGEILRLRWSDIDLSQRTLIARSLKQSRHVNEVARRIDLHAALAQRLSRWRSQSKRGQFVVVQPGTLQPVSPRLSITLFSSPLRHTRWCLDKKKSQLKIGYHTYRHSFASNLAAAGVDQRIIDEWMGHTTEAMRKRYR